MNKKFFSHSSDSTVVAKRFLIITAVILIGAVALFFIMPFISLGFSIYSTLTNVMAGDYRVFRNTPAWELARAVGNNDTVRIREIVQEDSRVVNYQDTVHGFTVLMTGLCHSGDVFSPMHLSTIETLLRLGADPNLYGEGPGQSGHNAVTLASSHGDVESLELLLRYGGNPNSQMRKTGRQLDYDKTALIAAMTPHLGDKSTECMRLLINAGADVNAGSGVWTALSVAFPRYQYILYLLEHGADPAVEAQYAGFENKMTLIQRMRRHTLPLDSERYSQKLQVIDFLRERGIDYYAEPIPDYILDRIKNEHPDDWEEYTAVY